MGNLLFMLFLVVVAVAVVTGARIRRDRTELAKAVRDRGGEVARIRRARKGHPFPDSGRGWWAWKVTWKNARGEQSSWVLTTRDGIKEWRD